MDIEGLGEKRAEQLIGAGLIKRLSSLYELTKEDLLPLERFAEKSAEKLITEIENSKERTLPRYLYALGIPLVGEHMARVLAGHFETFEDLMEASEEELEGIRDIGPEVAQSIVAFFLEDKNRAVIGEIQEAGLKLHNPYFQEEERPLDGWTFVFTGSLESWTRHEVKRHVERLGGRATSSVSGETDYVVAGAGAGSKLDEAQRRDIPVMDEEQFKRFLEEKCDGTDT
jgi:DNA ligase (NAD+)